MDMSHMVPELHSNPLLVDKIVQQLKINGLFDEMRRECLADIDAKPAFDALKKTVENHVKGMLAQQLWKPSMNKNMMRSKIRDSVLQSGILNDGINRLLHEVFDAKVMTVFFPKIADFIEEKGDELKMEFMPPEEKPAIEMPPMVNPQFAPPYPMQSEMHPDVAHLPPMPVQPPLPSSPYVLENPEADVKYEPVQPTTPPQGTHDETTEISVPEYSPQMPEENTEVPAYSPQMPSKEIVQTLTPEYIPKESTMEIVESQIVVSPSPNSNEPHAPMIPEDAVNPLRSLIQTLLTSKSILHQKDSDNEEENGNECETKEVVTEVGFSPSIDPSQIEAFTDDEETSPVQTCIEEQCEEVSKTTNNNYIAVSSPPLDLNSKKSSGALQAPSRNGDEPNTVHPATPPSPYSPTPVGHSHTEELISTSSYTEVRQEIYETEERSFHPEVEVERSVTADKYGSGRERSGEESSVNYDPMKFSYERMSSPLPETETSPQSPPSPTSQESNPDEGEKFNYYNNARHLREKTPDVNSLVHHSPLSSATPTTTDSTSSSSESSSDSDEGTIGAEVEETVEEIEVVEEYSSRSDSEQSTVTEKSIEKSTKKKKAKAKKRKRSHKKKQKISRKRKLSRSSVSSGEITSSGELSSDSSSDGNSEDRPTRPNVMHPRHTPAELQEIDDRRREMHRLENHPDRPYWKNTESSSDYLSSPPGRIPHRYSPPRRPYSLPFHRYDNERMEFDPHFRDRQMYREGEMMHGFRPPMHRPRFSPLPPGFHRRTPSPPHRFSPRMEYPHPPHFGSPPSRSPPRRGYSPPPHLPPPHHMMPGYPDLRHPFPRPPPHLRYGSPPPPSINPHRRSSRSPPPHPAMRMNDIPGPSRIRY